MLKLFPTFIFVCIFLLIASSLFGQKHSAETEFSFMFYNVENLFDCVNDSLTNDDEFTPEGTRNWTTFKLYEKLDRLSKVILAAGKWNPPVVVGLCEVENRNVLEMLVNNAALKKNGYKIIHKDSPDERGIDVAFLYRPDLFRPFDYQNIPVLDTLDGNFKTREILLVSGVINGCDTLHFFVNHWPSRYGGIMETAGYRKRAAATLRKTITRLNEEYSHPLIVCMGDFNDQPSDESLALILGKAKIFKLLMKGQSWFTKLKWKLPILI